MARKNKDGRIILSAGEIGAYTVCPEAWRLKVVERAKSIHAESVVTGQALHEAWANKIDDAAYLHNRVRFVALLIIVATAAYALASTGGKL